MLRVKINELELATRLLPKKRFSPKDNELHDGGFVIPQSLHIHTLYIKG